MTNLFYRNIRLLILTIIVIVVWGLSAFFSLPRLEDPEQTPRNAVITTSFPGASAERVESLVTEKLEQELLEVEEIDKIESTSRLGFSTINVQLKDEIVEVDPIWSRIRDQVNDVVPQLPAGAATPNLDETEIQANALIIGLTWELDSPPNYAILRRWSEELQARLRSLEGTKQVELYGTPTEEITVTISPERLNSLGLNVADISQQIKNSDAKVSAGQLRSDNNDLLFEVTGELDSLNRINNIPIQFGSTGQSIRLGDLAVVKKGIVEPASELALINGKPGIAIGAMVQSNQLLDRWAKVAFLTLDQFKAQLADGVGLHILFNQSVYVEAQLSQVISNLITGGLLVVAVTFFMMGWKSSLIVGSALPLATLTVFGCMQVLGIPLHQTSVTGVIIALGLLIDNAIIVVDEVQHCLKEGIKPDRAISKTVSTITIPLLASTVTTVLAFLPIVLAPGGGGEFLGDLGMTVILAIVSSLILSLTIIPALVGRLNSRRGEWHSPHQKHSSKQPWWQVGYSNSHLTEIYRWSLDKILGKPLLGIALTLILPISGFLIAPHLEQQFFPPTDRQQFYLEIELPTQTSIATTQTTVTEARQIITKRPEVVDVHWFMGKSAPSFYYNVVRDRENSANYAQGMVQVKPGVKSGSLIQGLQTELDRAFPQAQILVRQLEQGPPFGAPIELRLYGSDLDRLQELGNQARTILSQVPNVIQTKADLSEIPKLALNINEEEARRVGIDKTAIAQQLDYSLEGAVGGSVLEFTEELAVRVRLDHVNRSNLTDISSLNINTPNGSIPLSAVAEVQIVPDLAAIARRNGERVNTVKGYISAGTLPAEVLAQFQQQLKSNHFQLPVGYRYEYGGEADTRGSAVGNLFSSIGILLILMVATLVLTFNSFKLAAVIAVIAVLSVGLGFGSLWLFSYPFGFTAILGTIALVGIAVNDSIVVLSALDEDPQTRTGGLGKAEALRDRYATREIVVRSTRHIISTTVTTVVGFIPLVLDPSGFWPPLAITIVCGLGGATLMALYFIPCIYLLICRYPNPLLLLPAAAQVVGLLPPSKPSSSKLLPGSSDRGSRVKQNHQRYLPKNVAQKKGRKNLALKASKFPLINKIKSD
ncbi:acriflavin resistance protein [Stanieria cyanosphaera PCC 7437]|uniref:Acriflavin resistance protein n=1 Tax=Stanieria cyanosphaera (strain ATCC 29371 / PCC 7437) TaxID=111780 RepID=K9XQA2_STAC7|nr:efflux RND transporter permease subunit [Stanieria cyanosphaera]AFZ33847.1 acriflavin resistance protein [Stanieria cyanosphaera PCC 7437]